MIADIDLLKGLHPGIFLERELQDRKIAKSRFALALNEYPQVLGDITKAKRKMNIPLALKIEKALGLKEGFLMMLQLHYDIKQEKRRQHSKFKPDLEILRPVLFWDTRIENIDWIQHKNAVIERVQERGTNQEKAEIERFYNLDEVKAMI
jgi:addiction module HigA family antidote